MRRLTVLFILILIAWLSVACGDASVPAETAAEANEPGGETAVVDETEPAEPTTATEPVEAVEAVPTAVPSPTTNTPADPTATPPLRAYARDAANLLNLVDLSQAQPLSPEMTANGRITPDALAIPYTYQAQAGEILLIELLLPNLTDEEMQTIRPAILIADAAGNELGYMRGAADFVTFDERRSIAQAGFVAPTAGEYTILATLDGHQNPQNPVYEADFTLTVTPATPLTINQPHEATRASSERHVYAVTTSVGEFDLVYEDLAGTPPGQYAIEVKRLGSPSDGTALHDTLAAGGAVNQTYSHQDTAAATIAERMGLAELTYFIFVQSSTLPGQEQEPYTSNYRLTIVQDEEAAAPVEEAAMAGPTPTPFTSAIAADETWGTRLNHTMRVQFQIPAGWGVADGNNGIYGRDGASLTLSLEDHVFADAAAACQGLTQGIAAEAFGAGTGEIVTVNGLDVCVISHPQDGEPYRAIIKYPESKKWRRLSTTTT